MTAGTGGWAAVAAGLDSGPAMTTAPSATAKKAAR